MSAAANLPGGWSAALDAQNDLYAALRGTAGKSFLQSYVSHVVRQAMNDNPGWSEAKAVDYANTEANLARCTVERGTPVWVSAEVVALLEAASGEPSFEPTAIFAEDLLLNEAFCLFEGPLHTESNSDTSYRAVSWLIHTDPANPGRQTVAVALWVHALDVPKPPTRIGASDLFLEHVSFYDFGRSYHNTPGRHTNWWTLFREVQVLWRLAKQRVVVADTRPASRATRRRPSNWRELTDVTVMTLRRSAPSPEHAENVTPGVQWSHRWWVSGHWRNQWYGRAGSRFQSQIWIADYQKGPAELALKDKQRVARFTR